MAVDRARGRRSLEQRIWNLRRAFNVKRLINRIHKVGKWSASNCLKTEKKTSCKFEILQPTVDLRLSGDKPNIQNLEPSANRYKTDQTLIKNTKKEINSNQKRY